MAEKTDLQKLLYRGQYFLGQKKIDLPDWKHLPIEEKGWLSVHPDLNVVRLNENGFSVILLGFLLDPERPQDDDKAIITRLCQAAASADEFIRSTDAIRWSLADLPFRAWRRPRISGCWWNPDDVLPRGY